MIRIPSVCSIDEDKMRKGTMRLCHRPNEELAFYVKNLGGYCRIFTVEKGGNPSLLCLKYLNSKNDWWR